MPHIGREGPDQVDGPIVHEEIWEGVDDSLGEMVLTVRLGADTGGIIVPGLELLGLVGDEIRGSRVNPVAPGLLDAQNPENMGILGVLNQFRPNDGLQGSGDEQVIVVDEGEKAPSCLFDAEIPLFVTPTGALMNEKTDLRVMFVGSGLADGPIGN
jgi:hypothetical protein